MAQSCSSCEMFNLVSRALTVPRTNHTALLKICTWILLCPNRQRQGRRAQQLEVINEPSPQILPKRWVSHHPFEGSTHELIRCLVLYQRLVFGTRQMSRRIASKNSYLSMLGKRESRQMQTQLHSCSILPPYMRQCKNLSHQSSLLALHAQ